MLQEAAAPAPDNVQRALLFPDKEMVSYLCCARELTKQLLSMQTSCKKGQLAAEQCRQILHMLRQYGPQHQMVMKKRTYYGEARLKNCVKYDLGNGYRLVTILQGDFLFIPFVGSHDKTDTWLELRRSGWNPNLKDGKFSCEEILHANRHDTIHSHPQDQSHHIQSQDIYEENLLSRIDDQTLQSVFRGLLMSSTADE